MRIPLPVAATRRTGAPVLAAAVACFIAATVTANLATAWYGLWPVGFGLSATAGSYAAGMVLAARDWVHETAGRAAVFGCIAAGALASAVTARPRLAAASAAAFAIAETVDLLVYTPIRRRRGWAAAVLASNTVGAIADTLLFLRLAGFSITTGVIAGQLVAKTTATLAVLAAAVGIRALLRHRLQPPGA